MHRHARRRSIRQSRVHLSVSWVVLVSVVSWCALHPSRACAETSTNSDVYDATGARDAFARPFAITGYAAGWLGGYDGLGIGGRVRWQPFARVGLELYSEHFMIAGNGGMRHDHPVGFNVYVPFPLTSWLRLRALGGFCAVLSFVEPDRQTDPRWDDVLFGVHAGLGIEAALSSRFSMFLDAQALAYVGHDRSYASVASYHHVSGALGLEPAAELQLGLQIHLGAPRRALASD